MWTSASVLARTQALVSPTPWCWSSQIRYLSTENCNPLKSRIQLFGEDSHFVLLPPSELGRAILSVRGGHASTLGAYAPSHEYSCTGEANEKNFSLLGRSMHFPFFVHRCAAHGRRTMRASWIPTPLNCAVRILPPAIALVTTQTWLKVLSGFLCAPNETE